MKSESPESSKLSLGEESDEENGVPEPDPMNYQFYFDKVQIVGDINFKEDHDKLFKPYINKKNSSKVVSPMTKSTNSKVRFYLI